MSRSRKHQFSCFFLNRASVTLAFNLGVFLLTVLLFSAGAAWAKPTTPKQAQTVVRNWLSLDAVPLGAPLGRQIKKVRTFNDDAGQPDYYVVYLNPSGLVFLSADDLVEPIIAFVSGATSYDPDPTNPLGALVSRDIPSRVLKARQVEAQSLEKGAAPGPTHQVKARQKWASLLNPTTNEKAAGWYDSIYDVWVAPLLQSRWNQKTVDNTVSGPTCYNYYTPNNYDCGCVATAMAQLMRYWQYPINGIGVNSFTITVDGTSQTNTTLGGDGAGGPYVWGSMVLDPVNYSGLTTIQRQAIGALTYDAGLSVNMSYNSGGSGSELDKAVNAFTSTFDYSNAKNGKNSGANLPEADLYAMVNPNLNARYPVLFAIQGGSDGHAIVCDGYGYNSLTIYHHLNVGWSGEDNAWYNLPAIPLGDVQYTSITGCVYNIYPSGSGEIIAGRVTDNNLPQKPISGATVTATGSGGPYTTTTDVNGIYALAKVSSSTAFTVSATKAGYTFPSQSVTTGTSTDNSTTTGNLWGIDFVGSAIPCSIAPVLMLLLD